MGHPVGDGGGPHQVLEAWNGVKWTLLAVVILDFMLLQGTFWRIFALFNGGSVVSNVRKLVWAKFNCQEVCLITGPWKQT